MAVDVSADALDIARKRIGSRFPDVSVVPIVANYVTHPPQLESFEGTTLAIYLGSSIGNFSPEEARAILQNLSSQLQSGDALLLGTDMVKDESILLAAYDDRDGITAEFNLNILHRLNRELGADFDPANFQHALSGTVLRHGSKCTWRVPMTSPYASRQRTLIFTSHNDSHKRV